MWAAGWQAAVRKMASGYVDVSESSQTYTFPADAFDIDTVERLAVRHGTGGFSLSSGFGLDAGSKLVVLEDRSGLESDDHDYDDVYWLVTASSIEADAGGPYTGDEGGTVALSGSGTTGIGSTIASYEWDFDEDGQFDDATGASPEFSGYGPGVFPVGLKVTDDTGAWAADTAVVTIDNLPPTLSVSGNQTVYANCPVDLSRLATFADPNVDGSETFVYTIDWDDGTTPDSGIASVNSFGEEGTQGFLAGSHVYAHAGVYSVQVGLDDGNGGTDERSFRVTVVPLNLAFVGNTAVDEGVEYTLGLSGGGLDETAVDHWTVDWGDGDPEEIPGNATSATHYYNGGATPDISASVTAVDYEDVLYTIPTRPVALDATFGGATGTATAGFENPAYGSGMAVQSDGKIVLVGSVFAADRDSFALARFNPDGTLDTEDFNGTGMVTTEFDAAADAYGVAVQADGKIVVVGASDGRLALVRYNSDGSLDTDPGTGFGGVTPTGDHTGIVLTTLAGGGNFDYSVAVDPSTGKIWVAGSSAGQIDLVRFNTDGTLDTTFNGGAGVATAAFGGRLAKTVVAPDGTVLAAGDYYNATTFRDEILLARYTPAGVLDEDFNDTGEVTLGLTEKDVDLVGVTIQPGGQILVAGSATDEDGGKPLLVHYSSSGELQESDFSDASSVWTALGGSAMAVDSSGRILVAGVGAFTVARCLPSVTSLPVTVQNLEPVLTVIGDQTAAAGHTLNLPHLGIFTDPALDLSEGYSYTIDWGDGTSTGDATVDAVGSAGVPTQGHFDGSHAYQSTGSYTVEVTIEDPFGGSTEDDFQVTVDSNPVTVSLAPSTSGAQSAEGVGQVGVGVNLVATAAESGQHTFTYTWTVNGDQVSGQSQASMSFTPDAPGLYVVTVTATDEAQRTSAAARQTVVVVAPTLYWDPDGVATGNNIDTGAGLGGTGAWADGGYSGWPDITTETGQVAASWYDPFTETDVAWTNAWNVIAVFAGADGEANVYGQVDKQLIRMLADVYINQATPDACDPEFYNEYFSPSRGIGPIWKTRSTTTTLRGNGQYGGNLTIMAGIVRLGKATALGVLESLDIRPGAKLDLNGWNLTVKSLKGSGTITNTFTSGPYCGPNETATLTVNQTGLTQYTGVIRNSGTGTTGKTALVKRGTGTLILSGANTFTGGTTIDGGCVKLGNGGNLRLGSVSAIGNGGLTMVSGRLDLQAFNLTVTALTGSGGTIQNDRTKQGANTLTVNPPADCLYAGIVRDRGTASSARGTVNLIKTGVHTLTLTGTNTYTGTTTVGGGTLQVGNGGTSGTLGSGLIQNDSSLVFNFNNPDGTDGVTMANVIKGSGTLTKIGAGKLTLTGSRTYTGVTKVDSGILDLSGSFNLSSTVHVTDGEVQGTCSPIYCYSSPPIATVTDTGGASPGKREISLRGKFTDLQAPGGVVLSIQGNNRPDLFTSVSINSQDVLTLAYAPFRYGTATITVRATGSHGLFRDTPFLVTLNESTDPNGDPALLAAVRQTLALSPNEPLDQNDWNRLTSLVVDSNQVRSLAGIGNAHNLESLTLVPSDFSDLGHLTDLSPLNGLTSLTEPDPTALRSERRYVVVGMVSDALRVGDARPAIQRHWDDSRHRACQVAESRDALRLRQPLDGLAPSRPRLAGRQARQRRHPRGSSREGADDFGVSGSPLQAADRDVRVRAQHD